MDHPLPPDDIARRLFGYLRRMDAEAVTPFKKSGRPVGLSDYGRHARPELARPQNEVEWSRRLAALLSEDGYETSLERRYPSRPVKRCDLVVSLAGGQTLWVEVKRAWRDYWGGNHPTYRSYLLHPLVPGLDPSKTHTVPLDLLKLSTLRPPDADSVAELLVAFERPEDPIDGDVDTLVSLAGLSSWEGQSDSWMSPTVPGQRVRCWFWRRPADGGWTPPIPT